MARLRADGVSIVYISHFLEEVQRIADRYTVLRDGRTVGSGDVATTSVESMIEQMAGRRLEDFFPKVDHDPGEVILQLSELAGPRLPVTASLDLRRGELLGIFGLVGAGRTELLRGLFALDPVRRGEVRLAGVPAPGSTPRARLDAGIGLLSEDRKEEGLALGLSIARNTTLSKLGPFTRFGWIRGRERDAATSEPGSTAWRSAAAGRPSPCPTSRAATSRRWRSRASCTTTSTCCCSTSRRAASTWAPRSRSTA